MILSSKVRMTDEIRQRQTEVFDAIHRGAACRFLYCITMPSCENNLLDIHPYREIYNRKEYDSPYWILGLAENRQGAVQLVFEMAKEAAAVTTCPEDYKKNFRMLRDACLVADGANRKE